MISVVVCTFNRASVLRRMLESFYRQEGLSDIPYELLVVDNNSSDGTEGVAHQFLKNLIGSYFRETKQGLSFARNRGIQEAKGDFVAFLDDDVLVDKAWLRNLKACFDQTDADVVGGKVSLHFEVPPEQWMGYLFRKCLSEVDLGDARLVLTNGDGLYGANLSFRKTVFDSAGLFDTQGGRTGHDLLSGEETQMVKRILAKGGKVVYDPDVHVEHLIGPERLQWRYFVRRAAADGLTLEFLDPKASKSFQVMRVCKASLEFGKSAFSRYSVNLRTRNFYERRLAEFRFRRQRSYLTARFVRLMKQ